MAVRTSKFIQPSNSTDALFRSWSKFIYDTMIDGGWVQTGDTGQINFTTVTRPLAANTAMGYIIMRMDDALQSTAPIYVRLDFGSSGAANNMGVWITIGPASDGAGVITTSYFSSPTASPPPVGTSSSSAAVVRPMSYGSSSTSRVHVCVGLDIDAASQSFPVAFSLERTKSGSGNDDAAGVVLYYSTASAAWNRGQYLFAAAVPQPPIEQGIAHVHAIRSPSAQSQNVGGAIPFPMAGLLQQPVKGLVFVRAGDWVSGARIKVLVYGVLIEYQSLFSQRITFESQDSSALVLMRFE